MTHFGVNSSNDFGNIEYVDNNLNTSLTFYSWYFTSYSFQRGVSAYICFKGSLSILSIQALTSNGPGENIQGIKKLPPTTQGRGTGLTISHIWEDVQASHFCTVPNWTPEHISVRAELWLPVCACTCVMRDSKDTGKAGTLSYTNIFKLALIYISLWISLYAKCYKPLKQTLLFSWMCAWWKGKTKQKQKTMKRANTPMGLCLVQNSRHEAHIDPGWALSLHNRGDDIKHIYLVLHHESQMTPNWTNPVPAQEQCFDLHTTYVKMVMLWHDTFSWHPFKCDKACTPTHKCSVYICLNK